MYGKPGFMEIVLLKPLIVEKLGLFSWIWNDA